jgi:hypothetical protein
MSDLDDRKKAHENKFAYDEELIFKSRARGARLLGEWAADRIGLPKDTYGAELVNLITGGKDEEDIAAKIHADAEAKGKAMTKELILEKFQQCISEAREQIAKK